MSRRKQSNPVKSVTDESDEEIDTSRLTDIGLPSHILHFNSRQHPPSITSISTILEGSQFGPFFCSLAETSANREPVIRHDIKLSTECGDFEVRVTSSPGLWLHLVKTTSKLEESNLQFQISNDKIWCVVTRNILPDEEVVAATKAKMMTDRAAATKPEQGEPPSRAEECHHTSSSSVQIKTEEIFSSDVKMAQKPPSVKQEIERGDAMTPSSKNYRTTPSKSPPPPPRNTNGKNIMIHNLLNQPKSSYELVHECMFCGVKFSNPKTLQAHLTNYCSKKPQFDLSSTTSDLMIYSLLHNQLRYNFIASQLQAAKDLEALQANNSSGNLTKLIKTSEKADKNVEEVGVNHKVRIKKELPENDETETKEITKVNPSSKINEKSSSASTSHLATPAAYQKSQSYHSQLLDDSKLKNPPRTTSDFVLPFSERALADLPSKLSSATSPLLNFFPGELFYKNHIGKPSAAPFLNPFLVYPYFLNMPTSSPSDGHESCDPSEPPPRNLKSSNSCAPNPTNSKHPPTLPEKFLNSNNSPRSSKSDNPLDLSSKKENLKTQSPNSRKLLKNDPQFFPNDEFAARFLSAPYNIAAPSIELNSKNYPSPYRVVAPHHPPLTNRCVECNIVFFKTENYMAHKQHYCASRNNRTTADATSSEPSASRHVTKQNVKLKSSKASSEASKLVAEPQQQSVTTDVNNNSKSSEVELIATLNRGVLQYYCIPCKIKFSSLETLKAHKKFYCSSRFGKNGIGGSDDHNDDAGDELAPEEDNKPTDKKVFTCSSCGSLFQSEHLLMLHFCTGVVANCPFYQCPHCDYVAQSDTRLLEHIRGHAPSKVYKCVLCGYRGNTVRGMRMHGKMHNDAGETFTDDSMMEIEEPPVIPKKVKLAGGGGGLPAGEQQLFFGPAMDIPDLELIRIKNEPYKRRRSRKAYEKSEYVAKPCDQLMACSKCDASFHVESHLQIHMLSHMNDTAPPPPIKISPPALLAPVTGIKTEPTPSHHVEASQSSNSSASSSTNKCFKTAVQSVAYSVLPDSLLCPPVKRIKLSPSLENQELNSYTVPSFESKGLEKMKEEEEEEQLKRITSGSCPSPADAPSTSDENNPLLRSDDDGKYCKQCNINFMYASTYLAHKKYYCTVQDEADISVC